MKEYLTGDDLYSFLLLLRTIDRRTVLILEGESDCDALDPHLDEQWCKSVPALGKNNVLRAIELVYLHAMQRVLGIVDRDLAGIVHDSSDSPNLVATDDYDLDSTIFFTGDIAARVLSSFCARDRVEEHTTRLGEPPLDSVVRVAGILGVLRYISERDSLGLRVRNFPIDATLASDGTSLNIERVVVIAVRSAEVAQITERAAYELLKAELDASPPVRDYVSGHDLSGALAAIGRRNLGASVSANVFESAFRAALGCAELRMTRLYAAVMDWAEGNGTIVWSCAP